MGQSLNLEQRNFLRDRLVKKRENLSTVQTTNIDLNEWEYSRVKGVDEAIARLDANTYGFCEECGIEIPFKRLAALPETKFCIDCEKSLETENQARGRNADAGFLQGMKSYMNKGY
jgi:RNA polymerase-binding transcription factor DksA